MELAKERHDTAAKAQFEMASLFTSQRLKYEEAITKLTDELGEAKAKLSNIQPDASATAAAVAEAEQKLRSELEGSYMATLKGLEETLNGSPLSSALRSQCAWWSLYVSSAPTEVQGSMEGQLLEARQSASDAIAARKAVEAQLSELQTQLDSYQKDHAERAAVIDSTSQQRIEELSEKLAQQETEWRGTSFSSQRHFSCASRHSVLLQTRLTLCSESLMNLGRRKPSL